jgi:transcriptional regulator with XRE-family HTH domain
MLPRGTDPLAKRIGRKILLVRRARGLSRENAAVQMGLTQAQIHYIEKGYLIPSPKVARRIRNWMVVGATYEGANAPFEKSWALEAKSMAWKSLRFYLPPGVGKELYRLARRLNMSSAELSLMAIELFLANRVGHTTIAEARDHVAKTRMMFALQEAPELRDILECEMKIAIAAGVTLKQWHEIEAKTTPEVVKLDRLEHHELNLSKDSEEVDAL